MKLQLTKVKEALLTVTNNVYHQCANGASGNYIVWQEDSAGETMFGNGNMEERAIEGTIDFFTKNEFDKKIEAIEKALTQGSVFFKLNAIQFEEDTGYTHYEWIFEVM
ncbi:MAG: hypothetical protein RSD63_08695 [Eubacterium sp.]